MRKQIRILQIVNGLAIGGAEKKLLDLVGRLNRRGYLSVVCSIGGGGPLEKDFRALGVQVIILRKKGRFDITLIWRVVRLIRKHKIDIIQTTLWLADVVGAFAALMAGSKPVVSWETVTHGENDVLRTKRRHVLLYKMAMKTVHQIVAVSSEIKESLIIRRNINPERISVIHYGVDLKMFNRSLDSRVSRESLGIQPGQMVVGTVARIEPYKGMIVMQQAAIRLAKAYSDLTFIFAGDGSLRPALEKEVHLEGLDDQIHFLGFRDDVQEIMHAFDVFVLPSLTEGLPNVILEAMASGKPVIATRVGGIPEAVIDQVTGILINPGDAVALADAIRHLLADPSLGSRMGKAGRQRAEDYFSVAMEVERFDQLFESVINRKKIL